MLGTKDVWLNLDWQANHPGGSFYKADEYAIYNNRDWVLKAPLSAKDTLKLEWFIDNSTGQLFAAIPYKDGDRTPDGIPLIHQSFFITNVGWRDYLVRDTY
jgi:hypothetical protein